LSSVAFFASIAHLFFSAGRPIWEIGLLTAAFLLLGIVAFSIRQRRERDDGFLAVVAFSAAAWLKGEGRAKDPDRSADLPPDDDLAKSRFFAPAVRHYGAEAVRGPHAVAKIVGIFAIVSVFWALFDQSGSSWIRQAKLMRTVNVLGFDVLPSQLQALNPILVMLFIPFVNSVAYPGLEKMGIRVTALRRMTAGMLLAFSSFVAVAVIQLAIDHQGPGKVSILWQAVPYVIITISEVLVSITGLEFAYSQAPKRMKSTIMGFWLLAIALGNLMVSLLAEFGKLPLIQFFWVFAALMLVAGLLFGLRAHYYVERDFIQE
jgi:POT family proton-dependent oligopeptide transporter